MHKTAFSVTTAACSSHDCQKDPVLACTAESKSLLSATTLCHAGNASYCIFFCWCRLATTNQHRELQLQPTEGPIVRCQLCCQHVDYSVTKYRASFSSVLSLGPVIFHGTLGTTILVVRFVHKATMQFSLFTKSIRSASSRHRRAL